MLNKNDIKIDDCEDGFLQDQDEAILWVNNLLTSINAELGSSVRVRLGAYRAGAAYATVDFFEPHSDDKCVAITIHQSLSVIAFPKEFSMQLDIELPGIIDTLYFLNLLLRKLGGTLISKNLVKVS